MQTNPLNWSNHWTLKARKVCSKLNLFLPKSLCGTIIRLRDFAWAPFFCLSLSDCNLRIIHLLRNFIKKARDNAMTFWWPAHWKNAYNFLSSCNQCFGDNSLSNYEWFGKKQILSCVLNLSQSDFFVPHKTFSLFNILIVCIHVRQLVFFCSPFQACMICFTVTELDVLGCETVGGIL